MKESLVNDILFRRAFFTAMIIGTLCRFFVLRVKDKQYPSRPQDYLEQLIMAGLAASLGAIAFPALIDKEFSALTFLAVGIQQFQGLSKQEKITLENIDYDDMVIKGSPLIDNISSTYEVRSYVSLLSALLASIIYIYASRKYNASMLVCTILAALGGCFVGLIFVRLLRRDNISDVSDVYLAQIEFDGPVLNVNGVYMDNIGLKDTRKRFLEKAIAIELIPKDMSGFGTLCDVGQQQAIMHNIYIHLGVDNDADEKDIWSIARIDLNKKSLVIIMMPLYKDEVTFMQAAGSTPVIDTAKRKLSAYKKKGFDF
ncbi:MAG: YIEGIA domain-containing protein [Terrisporobacter sp.]|uniref:YIEGIA domain-containing protein n=1 Tax=Terrisporobacter sp. TaxID=1965305 RepID=UPI002FC5E490